MNTQEQNYEPDDAVIILVILLVMAVACQLVTLYCISNGVSDFMEFVK